MTNNPKKDFLILFFLLIVGLFAINSAALALQVTWPDSPAGTPLNDGSELPNLIQYLYEWGISLGGLAVFISLIIAGIQYLSSFGNPISMKEALDRIKSAFLGLILLLSSWLILNTINSDLTSFSFSRTPVPTDALGVCDSPKDCLKYKEAAEALEHKVDYVCTKGFCVQDFTSKLEPIPCTSVTIEGVTLLDKETKNIYIRGNKEFSYSTDPENCIGFIELYPKKGFWGGCGGEKQQILISGSKSYYTEKTEDATVNCIKLRSIDKM